MHEEELEELFLAAWRRTGKYYLTRKKIADLFGYSDGWVQLMLIKTQAEPRRCSEINETRLEYGLDMRLLNRKKNLYKYWARRHMADLLDAESGLSETAPTDKSRKKLNRKRTNALRGLERQLSRLKTVAPSDPLISDIEELLNGDL